MKKPAANPKVLVIDVGGSHVKCLATGKRRARRFVSGPNLSASRMAQGVLELVRDWKFDVVTVGYPGVVRNGVPAREPHNLGPGWVGFDFGAAFGRPVQVVNDAAMQALGAYRGGKMLFLGLGTGLGSALIVDGVIEPMELGHLRYSSRTDYEDQVGERGLRRLGKKRWRRKVGLVAQGFFNALLPDYIVLGGGNVRKLRELPPQCRRGKNSDAFRGGFRLWESSQPAPERRRSA